MDFRVLGRLTVSAGPDGEDIGLSSAERELLAVLLLFWPKPCSQDLLINVMWPDGRKMPDRPGKALAIRATRVRDHLGPAGREVLPLADRYGEYRAALRPGSRLDLAEFQALAVQADEALRDLAAGNGGRRELLLEAHNALEAAIAIWPDSGVLPAADVTGRPGQPLLPGKVTAAAAQLVSQRAAASDALIDVHLDMGQGEYLIPQLRAAVAAAPLAERRVEQLMVALYQAGRRDEAVTAYQAAETAAVLEYGSGAGPDLRRTLNAIRAAKPPETLFLTTHYRPRRWRRQFAEPLEPGMLL
jgi:DNA-binding SARP family transcriptional activator